MSNTIAADWLLAAKATTKINMEFPTSEDGLVLIREHQCLHNQYEVLTLLLYNLRDIFDIKTSRSHIRSNENTNSTTLEIFKSLLTVNLLPGYSVMLI